MRDYTKFYTQPRTARFMANLLQPKPGCWYLEPSAGTGVLLKAVVDAELRANVTAVEINQECLGILGTIANTVHIEDFLTWKPWMQFDGCIANPPFGNGTDLVAHVNKMRACCKVGAPMVLLVPKDFNVPVAHETHELKNWGTNKDRSITPIKIIKFANWHDADSL